MYLPPIAIVQDSEGWFTTAHIASRKEEFQSVDSDEIPTDLRAASANAERRISSKSEGLSLPV
jgi:hypothetical protein